MRGGSSLKMNDFDCQLGSNARILYATIDPPIKKKLKLKISMVDKLARSHDIDVMLSLFFPWWLTIGMVLTR